MLLFNAKYRMGKGNSTCIKRRQCKTYLSRNCPWYFHSLCYGYGHSTKYENDMDVLAVYYWCRHQTIWHYSARIEANIRPSFQSSKQQLPLSTLTHTHRWMAYLTRTASGAQWTQRQFLNHLPKSLTRANRNPSEYYLGKVCNWYSAWTWVHLYNRPNSRSR